VEWLKVKALSSSSSTTKKKKEREGSLKHDKISKSKTRRPFLREKNERSKNNT
jgi:hypothetical protein